MSAAPRATHCVSSGAAPKPKPDTRKACLPDGRVVGIAPTGCWLDVDGERYAITWEAALKLESFASTERLLGGHVAAQKPYNDYTTSDEDETIDR